MFIIFKAETVVVSGYITDYNYERQLQKVTNFKVRSWSTIRISNFFFKKVCYISFHY